MTYGAISSGSREGRERQELFAGADPQRSPYQVPYQQQQQMPQQELSNEELMQQAVTAHKDTTATAKRALQVSIAQILGFGVRVTLSVMLMAVDAGAGARANQGDSRQHSSSPC
jgi:hypothetical protein